MMMSAKGIVKEQAEREGLDGIFIEAGLQWREPGCSMCLAMNDDVSRAGREVRLRVEPELRGAAGKRRTDAPRLPRDWRPPRPSQGASLT